MNSVTYWNGVYIHIQHYIYVSTYGHIHLSYNIILTRKHTHKYIYPQLLSMCHLKTCWGRGTEFHLSRVASQLTWCPRGSRYSTGTSHYPNKHFTSSQSQRRSSQNADRSKQVSSHWRWLCGARSTRWQLNIDEKCKEWANRYTLLSSASASPITPTKRHPQKPQQHSRYQTLIVNTYTFYLRLHDDSTHW